MGLSVETVKNNENNSQLNLSRYEGAIVTEVKPNSIAEENNIHRDDIIIEIDKTGIKNEADYNSELENYKKGDTIMLRILRNSSPLYIAFEIE